MIDFPQQLRCEYMTDPLGVGERNPQLSWTLAAERRGTAQRGYRIIVASSEELLATDNGDLWDSGAVESAETAHIIFGGAPLVSRQPCYWKVQYTDELGQTSPWSATAYWEMGLLAEADWHGEWMSYAPNEPELSPRPASYFRAACPLREVAQVRAYVTARGIYELWVNGVRVGDALFAPGWTDYRQRLYVQEYDLTHYLQPGDNTLGLVLGEGWHCGRLGWAGNVNYYGTRPEIFCQVEINYTDGTCEMVSSGTSWQCAKGPIVSSGFLLGETYDARREMPGWCTPGFDATAWRAPHLELRDGVPFCFASYPPVRAVQELTPVAINKVDDYRYVIDMGQNMVGRVRLRVRGAAGTAVTLRYGEMLYPDGLLYTENLRSARSTDLYLLRGEGEEVFEPHFTFHGFRYVEVTGLTAPPTLATITGIVIHTDAETTGQFSCSDKLVNQLYSNIVWGQRGNFLEVPTDCPQRDERLGWMGDAQVFARTACYNMDLAAFFAKWMTDVNDAQLPNGVFPLIAPDIMPKSAEEAVARNFNWGVSYDGMPAWGDAGVIVPWVHYCYYGDTRLLARCYPHMKAWVDYLQGRSADNISPADGFGDWLSIGADTPKDVLATAFYAHVADLTARTATVLGKNEDAAHYHGLFQSVGDAFTRTFVAADGSITGDTQTGYVLALYFDLLPVELRSSAAAHLLANIHAHDDHLTCGFVGISYLQRVLTECGGTELAYTLLEQRSYPGWLYSVLQGATTIWERWDGFHHEKGLQDPSMNSFNHYSLGSVGEWLFATVAGIGLDPAHPGFAKVVIHPQPGGSLTWAEARHRSLHGLIKTRWERAAGVFTLAVTIPPNSSAIVYLPAAEAWEGGLPLAAASGITGIAADDGQLRCELTSGSYLFTMKDSWEQIG